MRDEQIETPAGVGRGYTAISLVSAQSNRRRIRTAQGSVGVFIRRNCDQLLSSHLPICYAPREAAADDVTGARTETVLLKQSTQRRKGTKLVFFQEIRMTEAQTASIDRLAGKIVELRLETPALLFLEMHLPVLGLAHASTLFAQPLLSPFFGVERVENLSRIFSERRSVETLLERIRELAEIRSAR